MYNTDTITVYIICIAVCSPQQQFTQVHTNPERGGLQQQLTQAVYGRGRGLWGPVGVRWCACDIINHVHTHLAWLGGVGRVSV